VRLIYVFIDLKRFVVIALILPTKKGPRLSYNNIKITVIPGCRAFGVFSFIMPQSVENIIEVSDVGYIKRERLEARLKDIFGYSIQVSVSQPNTKIIRNLRGVAKPAEWSIFENGLSSMLQEKLRRTNICKNPDAKRKGADMRDIKCTCRDLRENVRVN